MSDTGKIYNTLLQKYDVKIYDDKCEYTTCDILNDFLTDNFNENSFYIIDLAKITKAYNKWTNLLPNIKPYYAVKCNNNKVLLETLAFLGCNFDCASKNEIKQILEITDDPSRIIFANPCKMTSHIQYARAIDVDLMTFDCPEELDKIKLFHPYAKLVLRIAVDDSESICKFNKKFGCYLSNVENLLNYAKTIKLQVIGFSFHVGSGCKNPSKFYEAIQNCRKAYDIAAKNNIEISLIDIGGGFPGEGCAIKFEDIAIQINKAMDEFFGEELANKTIEFISEPGRYFAYNSHILVLNVIGKKIMHDEHGEKHIIYYLNDGVYGSFNCMIYDHAEAVVLPFNERNEQKLFKSTIFGPTCDSIDLISENVMLPELTIGEWVYVENFGAYTVAASSEFNGFITKTNKYIYRS